MLRAGTVSEMNRADVASQKAKVFNTKHDYYRNTRCTSTAQEEHSALPGGVIHTLQDSDDDDGYNGEQLEISKYIQELSGALQWTNQAGWDAAIEAFVFRRRRNKRYRYVWAGLT